MKEGKMERDYLSFLLIFCVILFGTVVILGSVGTTVSSGGYYSYDGMTFHFFRTYTGTSSGISGYTIQFANGTIFFVNTLPKEGNYALLGVFERNDIYGLTTQFLNGTEFTEYFS
jgi:hypothetical protein